ncbi:2-oxoacid:acceptor oxidoreductase subunit alpha [Ferruginivarius sediminum]|uniref:2-oxoacid:acceptor oxidoreductase subunit alpha n=1 Tax=Ferruginivarius sediminum TaxID=2661937 RepID=A0A369TBR0_9PROT|nr:2-oxoacid:acceptor oxidoreductase subunit alpha [Ferruginivarius sediminum]RDD62710.1 2-oxoacid:acceptor oxidoreductase subunit alpha [Ferruginivarius sediminum]
MEGSAALRTAHKRIELEHAVVRFAGDSGDGMQLTGSQFTLATALAGNDLSTFPDFPAEIRAPAGTTYGVSAFQIHFGAREIKTSGDELDVLVAMNPAALKVNLDEVKPGGLILVDVGAFGDKNVQKAGYEASPLADDSLKAYRVVEIDMSRHTQEAVKPFGLSKKEALRCKNMWALGLVYWMFGRDRSATEAWLKGKFAGREEIADANIAALRAGEAFGETAEMPTGVHTYAVPPAHIDAGLYRNVTGTEAMAWGLLAGMRLAGLEMTFCSYPITPASQLLHALAGLKQFEVTTFQAEDEIAACAAAIGASYAGKVGVTSSSGPGVALKTEAIGLAIATELPLIVVNSQRAGPSTGMPTKTEQSDLYQAVYGRNGDSPLIVLAARSPGDCFEVGIEAVRLATRYMTPVIVLTDGYIVNASQPWRIPDFNDYEPFPAKFATDPEGFHPYTRDAETLARPWAIPGTPGLEHRIGGLEKQDVTGNVSYDPANHQKMTDLRAEKVRHAADDIPEQTVEQGETSGRLAVVGWGSTYGPISRAVHNLRAQGHGVSHIHLRHIWPLPRNLGELLGGFDKVIVPEMNNGQLVTLLRAELMIPAHRVDKVTGKPFKISEIEAAMRAELED